MNVKLNSELARQIPAIDATTVTMKRNPRSRTIALSDCIVTKADGTQSIIAARNTAPARAKAHRISRELAEVDRINKLDRHRHFTAGNMAPIGNVE